MLFSEEDAREIATVDDGSTATGGKDWIGRLAVLTPLDPCTTASILRTVNDSVVANVNGVFAVAVGQGLLLSLGFWFVGVRSPVLWGAVGGLASIIPLVGAPWSGVPS